MKDRPIAIDPRRIYIATKISPIASACVAKIRLPALAWHMAVPIVRSYVAPLLEQVESRLCRLNDAHSECVRIGGVDDVCDEGDVGDVIM